ncbi:MAG: putative addiction module antidote protein [Deltaproteobacteria bacterium]|nr:putative addiction module antidote protein [Deltaproteobacteria bacterium]
MKKESKTKDYHEFLVESLKDPEEAAEYLNVALEEGDEKMILKALRNVAEAAGGMGEVAKKAHLSRMTLYRALSKNGNPEFSSFLEILKALKIKLIFKSAA